MNIPLFDIDWTLLKGGNMAHNESFSHAFRTVYNVEGSLDQVEYHGMTDRQVLIAVLELYGISREETLLKMPQTRQAMVDYFEAHKSEGECVALPGVVTTLQRLQALHVPCGLLTGNTEPIAWHKLETAGIRHFFTFGAFGDVTDRRVELIDIARQRCQQTHPDLVAFDLVIVGDAPRDVQCAKDGGIKAVAVASGKSSREQLADTNPDLLLDSLEETDKLIKFLQS